MGSMPRLQSPIFRQWINAFSLPFTAFVVWWQLFPRLWSAALLAVLVPAGCFFWKRRDPDGRKTCLIVLAGLICASLFVGAHQAAEPGRLAADGDRVAGRGVVLPDAGVGTRILFFQDGAVFPAIVLLREGTLFPGDKVQGEVVLSAGVSEEERGVGAAFAAAESSFSVTGCDGVLRGLFRLREKLLLFWQGSEVEDFCRAALLGDRSRLSSSLTDAFQASGAMHLLAVSGLHVSLTIGAVYGLLLGLIRNRRIARGLLLFCLPVAAVLMGGGLPVLRAVLMTGLSLIVSLSGRRPSSMTGLFLSAMLLVLFRPYAAGTASFLLTFCATFGILAAAGPLTKWFRARRPGAQSLPVRTGYAVAASFLISLSVFVVTLPCQAYFFGAVQPFSALYNVFLIPLFSPVVILGLVAAPAAFWPVLSFLKIPALWVGRVYLALIRFVSRGALGTEVKLGAAAGPCALTALALVICAVACRWKCDRVIVMAVFLMGGVLICAAFVQF